MTFAQHAKSEEAGIPEFGLHFDPDFNEMSRENKYKRVSNPYPDQKFRYIRFRLEVKSERDVKWNFFIRDQHQRIISAFTSNKNNCLGKTGCWTERLYSKKLSFELQTADENLKIVFHEAIFMPDSAKTPFYSKFNGSKIVKLEELVGTPDFVRQKKINANKIGMLLASGVKPGTNTKINWCCSGVLLSSDLFITNWHCGAPDKSPKAAYWKSDSIDRTCRSAILDLSWDNDDRSREFQCRKVEVANQALDFAVLRLREVAAGPSIPFMETKRYFDHASATDSEEISIIHHPSCRSKSITEGCHVMDSNILGWKAGETSNSADATEFSHACSTEGGSSGGPVFNTMGELVGLHHLGYQETDDPKINKAVKFEAIIQYLKSDFPDLASEIGY